MSRHAQHSAPSGSPPGGADPHVVVIGAGVIGVCCAYFLARRGARVTVLERDAIGTGASFGNAGTIAPGHGPINRPGRVAQALKFMLDPTSPLYIAPRWDPSLARWLWAFRRHCTAAHYAASLHALAPLGHATSALFDQLVEEEKLDCDYRHEGYYEVFRTEAGLRTAARDAGAMQALGFRSESLSGDALREREPSLETGVLGGVFQCDGATCDPHRFVRELAARAERHGASIRTNAEVSEILSREGAVTGVRLRGGATLDADAVILAAGAYGGELARRLDYRLPLQPAKGYHVDRDPRAGGTPSLGATLMLGESSVFCTPMSGIVRFAGTLEFSGLNHDIRRPRLDQLTTAAARYLRGVGPAEARSEWCGLRPCLPDGLPAIGPVPARSGLFVATGHAMLGLTLAPITGKLITEAVLDGRTSLDISAFRADRF